ncbi:Non-specific serine/threonine protein kinase [Bertholletia excelsa]
MDCESGFSPPLYRNFANSELKKEPGETDIVEKSPRGRYIRYNEILGRGAFKNVYKGFDEVDGIEVAWNQVSIDHAMQSPEHLERLYSEVHLLKTLKHESIIKFYGSWVDDVSKTINMITELFTSGNLRQYRKKHTSVDLKAIKNWARQILQGLCYLHSQTPPVIHRDLKCDNIFVNGNHGQVKLGDLGLATIMHRSTASSVIGTPEFMAPELYEEDYNELVDIYSFGMCILELVTCEYPYSECKNPAQIYKKVASGVKPAALGKVKDPEVRQFIEKCLLPAHLRMSAAELLKDPFFLFENSKEPPQLMSYMPKPMDARKPESITMEIDSNQNKFSVSTAKSISYTSEMSAITLRRVAGENDFKLQGQMNDDDSISFTLRIADSNVFLTGQARNIHFTFYLNDDTAFSIASEMVDQLELSNQDLICIAELIDGVIVKLLPSENLSFGNLSALQNVTEYGSLRSSSVASRVSGEAGVKPFVSTWDASDKASGEWEKSSNGCAAGMCDGSFSESVLMTEITKNSAISMACGYLSNDLGSLSIANQSVEDEDQCEELKQELDAIDIKYSHCIQQILRRKAEAMETAKKKWIARKRSAG